jgi:hypothetical protein
LLWGELASLWHVHFEFDYEIAPGSRLIEEGHTELLHYLFASIANDVSWPGVNG